MKVLTYRSQELITEAEKAEMIYLFGERPYNQFIELEMDMNYDTIHHCLVELFATIQCDRKLNQREQEIRERIAKGLTPSKSKYHKYVEQGLIVKLMNDANTQYKKEFDQWFDLYGKYNEIWRYFGVPFERECETIIRKAKAKLSPIPEPKVIFKIKNSGGSGQTDVFQLNNIEVKNEYSLHKMNGKYANEMYKKFPFLCKLYYSTLFEPTLQINVYDVYGSDKAVQFILNEMVKDGLLNDKYLVS